MDLVDVLVYVTVLNLAVEYVPAIIAETFSVSLLTAVLLKVVLELVVRVKKRVRSPESCRFSVSASRCRSR